MIEVRGLRKEYDGLTALRDISFTVPTGAVFGFIGPNGAGKTTTLKILGTLLEPTAGEARVMGVDVAADPLAVRRLIGWMPDQYGVYMDLKVWEYLDFFAGAYRLPRSKRLDVIDTVLALVDLARKKDALLAGLSRGMTQRLCLARALLHEPQVLLLDEPASGLDPQARIELRELFKELQRMGKTILVSSHILPELAEYCDGVAILQEGRILYSGSVDKLAALSLGGGRRLRLKVLGGAGPAREILSSRPEVRGVRDAESSGELEFDAVCGDEALAALLKELVSAGVPVASFREVESDLSDLFLKITRGENGEGGGVKSAPSGGRGGP